MREEERRSELDPVPPAPASGDVRTRFLAVGARTSSFRELARIVRAEGFDIRRESTPLAALRLLDRSEFGALFLTVNAAGSGDLDWWHSSLRGRTNRPRLVALVEGPAPALPVTAVGSIDVLPLPLERGAFHRWIRNLSAAESAGIAPRAEESPDRPTLTLREVEARHIRETLRRTHGRIGEAARLLGIHRNTLARKLRDHGA